MYLQQMVSVTCESQGIAGTCIVHKLMRISAVISIRVIPEASIPVHSRPLRLVRESFKTISVPTSSVPYPPALHHVNTNTHRLHRHPPPIGKRLTLSFFHVLG
jgi:hypothetical protein